MEEGARTALYLKGSGEYGRRGQYALLPSIPLDSFAAFTIALWARIDGIESPSGSAAVLIAFGADRNAILIRYFLGQGGNILAFNASALTMTTGLWFGRITIYWTMVADALPKGAAGPGMAVANGIGNLGGFLGPLMFGWLRTSSVGFNSAMIVGGRFLHHRWSDGAACQNQTIQAPRRRRTTPQRIDITPQWDRHGESPSFATLNQTRLASHKPRRVTLSERWYHAVRHGRSGAIRSSRSTSGEQPPRGR